MVNKKGGKQYDKNFSGFKSFIFRFYDVYGLSEQ